jgi:predicted transcriptional regulator
LEEIIMYSVGIAYLLWLVSGFGALGFHRFYLGKIPSGLLWMFTGGLAMVGSIYDFFTLPRQVREANIRNALYIEISDNSHRRHYVRDDNSRVKPGKDSIERIILRIAKGNRGVLTASEVALEGNISLDEAKKTLDALVNKGFAEIRVRKTGTIVSTLPELMDTDSPLEDY